MLSARAADLVDTCRRHVPAPELYTTLDRSDRAVEVGLEYLRRIGSRLVAAPDEGGSAAGIRADLATARRADRSRPSSTCPR